MNGKTPRNSMPEYRIPYIIDIMETHLADVLNLLLQHQSGQQMDVATAYFSIRGFEQVCTALPDPQGFRLLLGDTPLEGEDVGLRPDSVAYLHHELNAEPFTEATLVWSKTSFVSGAAMMLLSELYLDHNPNESGWRTLFCAGFSGTNQAGDKRG